MVVTKGKDEIIIKNIFYIIKQKKEEYLIFIINLHYYFFLELCKIKNIFYNVLLRFY